MSTADKVKESYLNPPPPSTKEPSASGVTTPDLASEKDQPSSDPSINGNNAIAPTDALVELYPTGLTLIPIFAALAFSIFLVALDQTILGTAIPKITDEFDGLNSVSWYGSAYFMTYGGFQPASGKFYKYFPLKASFLGSTLLFLLGSLVCAIAKNSVTFSKSSRDYLYSIT